MHDAGVNVYALTSMSCGKVPAGVSWTASVHKHRNLKVIQICKKAHNAHSHNDKTPVTTQGSTNCTRLRPKGTCIPSPIHTCPASSSPLPHTHTVTANGVLTMSLFRHNLPS